MAAGVIKSDKYHKLKLSQGCMKLVSGSCSSLDSD
jgi:hypothetical protein